MEKGQTIELKAVYKSYRTKTSVSIFKPTYKEIEAIRDITFTHTITENLGIFGKNGAGKTTLIKLLTGILPPTSGEIKVLGFIPYKLKKEFKKQIGLFQGGKGQLIWDIPAIQSLELSRYIYGYSKDEFLQRLADFSKALDIGDELNQPLRNMSLGQRCKMELMFSFLHLPRLVFLDEPTSGLDIITRSNLRSFINYCHQQYGICFVISSHNVKDITDCCKSCIILDKGHILYQGDTNYLLEKYQYDIITINVDSEDMAKEISNKFDGKLNGSQVILETSSSDTDEVITQLLSQYNISAFKLKRKDTEDIFTEILKNE